MLLAVWADGVLHYVQSGLLCTKLCYVQSGVLRTEWSGVIRTEWGMYKVACYVIDKHNIRMEAEIIVQLRTTFTEDS